MQYYILQSFFIHLDLIKQRIKKFLKRELWRLRLRRRGRFSSSNLMSLAFRPWFEGEKTKLLLGAPLMAFAIVSGTTQIPDPNQALSSWDVEEPISQLIDSEYDLPVLTNESGYGLPVEVLSGISQKYHAGHPGMDLRSPQSKNVISIDNGVVKDIIYSQIGYGTHIIMNYDDETTSLYAHLQNVKVAKGQYVTKGQPLAEIGMTGLSTGPHLHLEISVKNNRVNPLPLLSSSIAEYQEKISQQTQQSQ